MPKQKEAVVDAALVHAFVEELFADDLHARRVMSLANGVVGAS